MRLCGWCEQRIWPWPWQHYAFRVTEAGETRYHTRCYQYIQHITQENQRQYSYEDFLARLEDEDGGW